MGWRLTNSVSSLGLSFEFHSFEGKIGNDDSMLKTREYHERSHKETTRRDTKYADEEEKTLTTSSIDLNMFFNSIT